MEARGGSGPNLSSETILLGLRVKMRGSKVPKRHQSVEATACDSRENVWRRSRIRGQEADLNHNRHGSDEMRGSTSYQRSIAHGKRSKRISIFAIP